ncbi:MAG TPA: hypothetical protein VGB85_25030, partial [Nannocystis sp.]
MDWRVRVAAITDLGPARSYNEDAVAVFTAAAAPSLDLAVTRLLPCDRDVGLLVIDGMGGQHTGDVPCGLA